MTTASDLSTQIQAALKETFSVPTVDLNDAEFQIPETTGNPLYEDIAAPSLDDLTTGIVDGTGAFDRVMQATAAHLQKQYDMGRITGADFAKAHTEITVAALNTGLQFVLQGEVTRWQAITAQAQARRAEIDAVTAKLALETAKYELAAAAVQTKMLEAQHVLTQMQIATEDGKHQLTQAQMGLVIEQTEAQRAQTSDTRSDGTTQVVGLMGKQKALYDQQISSYQRADEVKVGKMFVDSWITQKTLDEGLLAPDQFTNANVDEVLNKIRDLSGLSSTP